MTTATDQPIDSIDEPMQASPDAVTRARYASALVGFAGLSVLTLLLGVSPLSLWPFVTSVALALCALMLSQGRSVLGIAAIGILTGALWAFVESWRTETPAFVGWMVPMAGYTVLLLVIHHSIQHRVALARAANPNLAEWTSSSPLLDPAAESVETFLHAFNRWHQDWADQDEPWPAFDCFLREHLLEHIGARHVRVFRVVADGNQLLPLSGMTDANDPESGGDDAWATKSVTKDNESASPWSRKKKNPRLSPPWKPRRMDAHADVEGYVVANKQAYIKGCPGQGERIRALAERSLLSVVWCFPVTWGEEVIGLVQVGHLPRRALKDPATLRVLAELVSVCWNRVRDVHELGIARRTDLASGVLARSDFLTVAGHALADACTANEPVSVLVLALEGMRSLDDNGQWDFRDRYVRRVGSVLNRKLRADDVIGRFTDDRFVILLRRVDTALGEQLAEKLQQSVVQAMKIQTDDTEPQADITPDDASPVLALEVRCALVGGHWPKLPNDAQRAHARLHELIGHAFSMLEVARLRAQNVIAKSDAPDSGDDAPVLADAVVPS